MTGAYLHHGVEKLLEANIPVYDVVEQYKQRCPEKCLVSIREDDLYLWSHNQSIKVAKLERYTFQRIQELKEMAKFQYPTKFLDFVYNSLTYAKREAKTYAEEIPKSNTFLCCKDRRVLIVTRGEKYEDDLQTVLPWIKKEKLIIIAVDGGADGLIKLGIKPHIIFGDMDSVTDKTLRCGAQIVLHQYVNGNAPGESRIVALGLQAEKVAFPGTSEDIAILLPFWAGAKKLFVIGSHTSMIDFLDKGRQGMGSSLLTRIQTGHYLVDLRGIHEIKDVFHTRITLSTYVIPASAVFAFLLFSHERLKIIFDILMFSLLKGG